MPPPPPPRLTSSNREAASPCEFPLEQHVPRLRHLRLRLEPAAENPEGTVVVEVPVDAGEGVRTARDLSMWEQLSFAAFLQRYWADNQASIVRLACVA